MRCCATASSSTRASVRCCATASSSTRASVRCCATANSSTRASRRCRATVSSSTRASVRCCATASSLRACGRFSISSVRRRRRISARHSGRSWRSWVSWWKCSTVNVIIHLEVYAPPCGLRSCTCPTIYLDSIPMIAQHLPIAYMGLFHVERRPIC